LPIAVAGQLWDLQAVAHLESESSPEQRVASIDATGQLWGMHSRMQELCLLSNSLVPQFSGGRLDDLMLCKMLRKI